LIQKQFDIEVTAFGSLIVLLPPKRFVSVTHEIYSVVHHC